MFTERGSRGPFRRLLHKVFLQPRGFGPLAVITNNSSPSCALLWRNGVIQQNPVCNPVSFRLIPPSCSRLCSKADSSRSPWAWTQAWSPTQAASSCLRLTPQCLPTSSSTHWPAWLCSLPLSHPHRSQWLGFLSRMLTVCIMALSEQKKQLSRLSLLQAKHLSLPCGGLCRFSGPKQCHGQLWAGDGRRQRSGDHSDHQQLQPDTGSCPGPGFSCWFWHCCRKPSGDHPYHIRYRQPHTPRINQKYHSCTQLVL